MTQQLVANFEETHKTHPHPVYIYGCTEHAQERFFERFGGILTPQMAVEWRQMIRAGECTAFPGRDCFQTICLCHWSDRNVEVPVVYDAWTDCIVTVLPRVCAQVTA